ncbi:type IX secretion system sortase PorU [Flavobacterium macacae]|uniref:Type IX secretion system sortase PorU n=1 Tax=Flavobacterium macacae TaxID=2488993 RepID=A0A3P3W770_9FLAO|nr:type IX secretion system sortase PorU [Flavobacterium macacae]RRJ91035.1 type IX secretion system sortase PorU [Flavobacterium macacae]
MKNTFLLLSLLFSLHSFAQQKETITIEWIENSGVFSEQIKIKIPTFKSSSFYYDFAKNKIQYVKKIPVNGFVDEKSFVVSNVVFESISEENLGDLNKKSIPNSIVSSIKNMDNNGGQKAYFEVSPIIKSGNTYQRIKSFSYSFAIAQNQMTSYSTNSITAISNSVLSSGDLYRFYVTKSGVYKISRSFIQSLGMNLNGVDPRNIKIYGNGGRMLPLLNSIPYPDDMAENAISIIGEEDGGFDNSDYILFYAEGVDNWNEESETHNNLFADKSYYYITSNGGPGKRIGNMPAITQAPTMTTTVFDDYQFHEVDRINVARLGRKWFGEQFNIENEQEFKFQFPNLAPASQINIQVSAAGASFSTNNMTVTANTQNIGTMTFDAIGSNSSTLASPDNTAGNIPSTETVTVKLTYNNNGVPSANAYLDYIILRSKGRLNGFGKQFRFQLNDAALNSGVIEYQFSNASGISQIWDITDIYNVSKTLNPNQNNFSFKSYLGEIRNYIAVDNANFLSPLKDSKSRVANQNLKGTILKNNQGAFQDLDYLIVTPASLTSQAERLANFHRNYSQLNVKVISLEAIYEEFSSGKQDIAAIRNFAKYIYNNASSPNNRLKYLNLFGDASFDYKNRIPNNTNIVPIFHVLDSFSLGSSYMTDDFYAMYGPNEGRMGSAADNMEISVGRMLVSDLKQAEEMVTKVIEYHAVESYGKWRNNFVLVSDDVDAAWENSIQTGIDDLGDEIYAQKPFINVKKIHTDSYVQEASAGGFRYPKARKDFFDAINQGALVVNYFGHGGEDGLAVERIFEKTDAQTLSNQFKYPLFITVTCEFTRFDNPYRPTAGEQMYWNPKGGAISMVTTTRQIDVNTGQDINEHLAEELFGFVNSSDISMAEALKNAKNTYEQPTLMVSYIGDPAIKLPIPKPTIVLTKVNDEPIQTSSFVLSALSPVKFTGEVRDIAGNNMLSNYNGDLSVNIFDKNIQKSTLGNDGTSDGGGLILMDFTLLGETIFRGNASVTNGNFEFSFVVPRDITIPVGNGRVSFYAKKTQALEDQTGYNIDIKIGGINPTAVADNIGPRVRLYMNDETFISGGITNESPIFLAFLEDENGINTASGIGHDIVAILDGDENNPYILNDYYETELDDYTKGKVRFPFRDLAVGLHTIVFKAWDVYNNPVTAEIQFIVVGDENVTLTNVLNYPNPFVNYTQFWFTHNKPYEPLDVQVQILTITGKIVKTINQVVNTEGFLSREITWDGKDDFGDRIGKGVYVYKLTVRSNLTNKKTEKYEKLVIL